MSCYNPDTQPFDLKLSNIGTGQEIEREALVNVADTVDFAKRILLQLKVKSFSSTDVIELSKMILSERDAVRRRHQGAF